MKFTYYARIRKINNAYYLLIDKREFKNRHRLADYERITKSTGKFVTLDVED